MQFRLLLNNSRSIIAQCVLFIVSCFISLPGASATDIAWTGAVDSLWHNADNWSPMQVPIAGDVVTIDSGDVYINNAIIAECYSLELASSTSLIITGSSTLSIEGDKSKDGIRSSGSMINLGTIVMYKVYGGIDSKDTIINYGTITITNIEDDGIYVNSSSGQFTNFGIIEIDTCDRGIYNRGAFINKGEVTVANASESGFRNNGSLNNLACGDILIDGGFEVSSSTTTENKGAFRWRGEPSSISSSTYFRNEGVIEDHGGTDSLSFTYIDNIGLIIPVIEEEVITGDVVSILFKKSVLFMFSDSLFTDDQLMTSVGEYSSIKDDWEVTINAEGYDIFYFEVDDVINSCIDTFSVKTKYVVLECNGTNTFVGTTSIDWMDASNWDLGHVPENCEHVIIKDSSVEIPSGDAVCKSLLMYTEDDTLSILSGATLNIQYGDFGIDMGSHNSLINEGDIAIFNIVEDGISAADSVHIYNEGSISIEDIGETGIKLESSHFYNDGPVVITDVEETGMYLYLGSISNEDSILISFAKFGGIYFEEVDSIENNGYFSIQNVWEFGWTVEGVQGPVSNSGIIKVEKVIGEYGLANLDSFYNYGELFITDVEGHGFLNFQYFVNEGLLSIESCDNGAGINGSTGIYSAKERTTKSSEDPEGYFLNIGSLRIDSLSLLGLENYATFINDTCGVIEHYNSFYNEETFINNGYFLQSSSDTIIDAGAFQNKGILVDKFGSFADCIASTTGCYISTGLRFGEVVLDSIYADELVENILLEESTTLTISSAWYSDVELSEEAGSYNQSDNEWTPSRKAIDHDEFYLEVTSLGEVCLDTISLSLEIPVLAPECDSINWEGSTSNMWLLSSNWDLKRTPSACDEVYIDSLSTVIVPSGDTAVSNTLIIQPNATFTIPNGSLIKVQE